MSRFALVNLCLIVLVVLIAAAPLVAVDGDFEGSDGLAMEQVTEHDPGYEPWFAPIYEPPSGEVASGLFALQAAIGAGFLGYFFGVARTRRRLAQSAQSAQSPTTSGDGG
ncbi:energy-coupling factor ABC transporter substrate-binding protein [Pseudonocardia sp.]|uniref:energy-coupling factor ABC transporter substrate-binding protein n=1 Tax=Pseudonocardia sp. TaxID=60912 RepID=UPI003D0BFD98